MIVIWLYKRKGGKGMDEVIVFILQRINEIVKNGQIGIDYTISDRDKNKALKRRYVVDDSIEQDILLDLQKEDYVGSKPSDNEFYPEDTVYKFIKTVQLQRRYQEEAPLEAVKLYIKIVLGDTAPMFVISFHEAEY